MVSSLHIAANREDSPASIGRHIYQPDNAIASINLQHLFVAGKHREWQIWAELGISGQTTSACLVRWSKVWNLYPLGCVVRTQFRGRSGFFLAWLDDKQNQNGYGIHEEELSTWLSIRGFRADVYSRVVRPEFLGGSVQGLWCQVSRRTQILTYWF